MTAQHLADIAAAPHTDEQVAKLRDAGDPYAREIRIDLVGGRLAIFQNGDSNEPVQFLTTRDPSAARKLCEGWSEHFASARRKGSER